MNECDQHEIMIATFIFGVRNLQSRIDLTRAWTIFLIACLDETVLANFVSLNKVIFTWNL